MLDRRKGWNKGYPSPHDIYRERHQNGRQFVTNPLDHDLLLAFLEHNLKTGEKLPPTIIVALAHDLELALSGREGIFFRKVKKEKEKVGIAGPELDYEVQYSVDTKNPVDPTTTFYRDIVVLCLRTSIKEGWFTHKKDAVATIADACSVGSSTLLRWDKEFPPGRLSINRKEFDQFLETFRQLHHVLNPEKHKDRQ